VAFNHVHHICNGYFSDGGGIYTLGISPGTVIRNNVVHDVLPTPLMPVGGCGIYHDEGSTGNGTARQPDADQALTCLGSRCLGR
jgi:hypothetical protein